MLERLSIELASKSGEASASDESPYLLYEASNPVQTKRLHIDINAPTSYDFHTPATNALKLRHNVYSENSEVRRLPMIHLDINRSIREVETVLERQPFYCEEATPRLAQPEPKRVPNVIPDPGIQSIIIRSTANAFLGFESDIFAWDGAGMKYNVPEELRQTRTGQFMQCHVDNGSFIRRCIQACSDIRDNETKSSQSVISLAAAVEGEVARIRRIGHDLILQNCRSMIDFTQKCNLLAKDTELLAMIIGCHNLSKPGRLKKTPSTVELLNRAYPKAQSTKSPMVWRLIEACVQPWLAQVSFVLGLSAVQLQRRFDDDMRAEFFPDLFITFPLESMNTNIDRAKVPTFLPFNIAQAISDCYYSLVHIGMKQATFSLPFELSMNLPLSQSITSVPHINKLRFCDLSENDDAYFKTDVRELDEDKSIMEITRVAEFLAPSLHRAQELDKFAKTVHYNELHAFISTVTNLFLFADGCLWACVCDIIDLASAKSTLAQLCAQLSDAVQSQFGSSAGVRLTPFGDLEVVFQPSETITATFGRDIIEVCQKISSRMLAYQQTKQIVKLGLFGVEAQSVITRIWDEFNKGESLRALVTAVREISQLHMYVP